MRRALAVFAAALLVTAPAGAYQWPTETPTIVATFGQITGAHFGAGISIVGSTADVRPIASGEVIFRYDPARCPTSLPRGLGAHVVVQHPERVRSAYTHLEPSSVTRAATVEASTILGRLGDSGSALGLSLGLYVIDMETATYLNPRAVLPPLADGQAPIVARLLLRRADSSPIELGRAATAAPGPAEVLVEAYDLREDVAFRWRLAPQAAVLSLNGRETSAVVFDALSVDAGELVDRRGRSASSIYAGPWLVNLGSVQLQIGETHLQVFVRDFVGNESSRECFLSIKG